jgi:hypothetical protein
MVCHSTFQSKNVQNSMFFFLIQSEYGDLYKLTMDYTGASVHGLSV